MGRFAQFAVAASREAIADAGLEITDENRERVGVMMNTGGGGIPTIAGEVRVMEHQGPRRVSSLLIPMFAPNMASCQVAIAFGVHGPTVTSVAACAADFIEAWGYPDTTQRMGSLYLYGIMRGLTFRRMRVPKAQVELGAKI